MMRSADTELEIWSSTLIPDPWPDCNLRNPIFTSPLCFQLAGALFAFWLQSALFIAFKVEEEFLQWGRLAKAL